MDNDGKKLDSEIIKKKTTEEDVDIAIEYCCAIICSLEP